MNRLLSIVIAFFFFLLNSWAATYYVNNTTGSNANNGSSGSPWKELPGTSSPTGSTSGWVTIQAGDTLYLAAGQTWTKTVTVNSSYYNNGSAEARITISSDSTSSLAVFDFSGGGSRAFDVFQDYVTLQYIEIKSISATNSSAIRVGNDGGNAATGVKILHCYIHEVEDPVEMGSGCTEQWAYAIELQNRVGTEIGYNTIKNINKKWISSNEDYAGGDEIHHNTMYQEASWSAPDPFDHGIVVSSTGGYNLVHDNILWNNHLYYGANYAINLVEAGDYNKVYNNIIRGFNIGIVVRTSGATPDYNEVVGNTIYLADMPGTYYTDCNYGEQHYGAIFEDGTGHIFKNNIVYYPQTVSGTARMLYIYTAGMVTVENNLFYKDGSTERVRIGSSYYTIAQLNDDYAWADANVAANPGFVGGNYPVSNLPDGFTSEYKPNNTGLAITVSSSAKDVGQTLASPYNVDVNGTSRTGSWDIGAYEYAAGDAIDPVATILFPTSAATFAANSSSLNLLGSASDETALDHVSWSCDVCGSGTATGTASWSISDITLQSGTNVITVTAYDTSDNTGTDTLTVTYTPFTGNYSTSLWALYKLDESSATNRVDSSGHGRDENINTETIPTAVVGKFNNAASFQSAADLSTTAGVVPSNIDVTHSFWFKWHSDSVPDTTARILNILQDTESGIGMRVRIDSDYSSTYAAVGIVSTLASPFYSDYTVLSADDWHWIKFTSYANVLSVYIDGSLVIYHDYTPEGTFNNNTPADLWIYNLSTDPDSYAIVDDWAVWERQLTAEEDSTIWNAGDGVAIQTLLDAEAKSSRGRLRR